MNSILTNVSCGCGYLTECTSIHYIPRYLQKAVVEKLLATHLVQVGRNEPRHKRMQNDLCHFAGRKQGGAWNNGFKLFIFSTFSLQYNSRRPILTKTLPTSKVIYTKYSKHWLYTVAHTFDCVCSKINTSWFNPFYFSSLYPAIYIEWCIC